MEKKPHPQTGRIVTVLSPTLFAPLAGFISLWLAKHAPGVSIANKDSIAGGLSQAAVFATGLVIAHLKSSKWLDGWQKWEERDALLTSGALPPPAEMPDDDMPVDLPEYDPSLDEDALVGNGAAVEEPPNGA
ncbi:MAG TPA: hypothetical protein VF545_04185 [Thermoleophilaceae bacterium]|jgi:hypothetical protein